MTKSRPEAATAMDTASTPILQRVLDDLIQAYDATLECWSRAVELRANEPVGHTARVTEVTVKLTRAMGLSGETLEHIRRGSLLHDAGTLGDP